MQILINLLQILKLKMVKFYLLLVLKLIIRIYMLNRL
nr:MAG TPA: hypothetical protein [Bacteriophage sp.]